jgi:RHS repeat-associated protein
MLDGVGLIHMAGRVYDPTVGRFLSVDPLVRDAAASQSWNGYGYVEGRVLSATDPSGWQTVDCPQCVVPIEPSMRTIVVTATRLYAPGTIGDFMALWGEVDTSLQPSTPANEEPGTEEPQGEESARDWWCEKVPSVSASVFGLEAQVAFFTVGLDINVDFGVTSHFQVYATASAAVGGGAGLGLNFLAGTGLGTGRVQTGLDAGLTTFGAVALAPGGPSGGGSIQFSGDGASAGATSIRGRGGAGFGGGLYAGVYGSGTIATPSGCGN